MVELLSINSEAEIGFFCHVYCTNFIFMYFWQYNYYYYNCTKSLKGLNHMAILVYAYMHDMIWQF